MAALVAAASGRLRSSGRDLQQRRHRRCVRAAGGDRGRALGPHVRRAHPQRVPRDEARRTGDDRPGRGGSIVNTASIAGRGGGAGPLAYSGGEGRGDQHHPERRRRAGPAPHPRQRDLPRLHPHPAGGQPQRGAGRRRGHRRPAVAGRRRGRRHRRGVPVPGLRRRRLRHRRGTHRRRRDAGRRPGPHRQGRRHRLVAAAGRLHPRLHRRAPGGPAGRGASGRPDPRRSQRSPRPPAAPRCDETPILGA